MDGYGILISAFFAFVAAGIYALVGRELLRRHIPAEGARLAYYFFSVWWFGLAATMFSGAVASILAFFGVLNLPAYVTITHASLFAICLSLMGLMYYLLYLFTGNGMLIWPLAGGYIIYYWLLVYFITSRQPAALVVEDWRIRMVFTTPVNEGLLYALALTLLLFPQIIGALAYFTLYFRVKDPTQRYRVLLVSWSIIIWFGTTFLATSAGLSQNDWWQIVSRTIGLGAALTILMAYLPPTWIRRRFGVASVSDEAVLVEQAS